MAFKRNSDWSLNKGSEDIVYSFLDGTSKRFRKIDGQVYVVTENAVTCKTTTMVPTNELSAEQFDKIKRWSDKNYQTEDRYEVHHSRGRVPLEQVENTIEASVEMFTDEDICTLENALRILKAAKLTATQRRRFDMYISGMTQDEIALAEGVGKKTVWDSLSLTNKKIQKIRKNF
ncbi:MAG: hypothetical protein ACI3W5_07815 [Faecousia sp.]